MITNKAKISGYLNNDTARYKYLRREQKENFYLKELGMLTYFK